MAHCATFDGTEYQPAVVIGTGNLFGNGTTGPTPASAFRAMWQSAWLWPVPADVLAANRGRIGPACRQQRQSWSSACSCEVLVRQYVAKHISSALNHIL
ncbi:MAG TPA: hypothetical protein VG815_21910, partial [Chloroflexota bacterium]|nr:hypothetical protein [Chloroflexota bacterium]